jgi:hypothetical protein
MTTPNVALQPDGALFEKARTTFSNVVAVDKDRHRAFD